MVNPQINDKIKVVINGREIETVVAGIERSFGMNSPIFVKFYIDWDEGPIEYRWPISEIGVIAR
jgi:hypothetical protein